MNQQFPESTSNLKGGIPSLSLGIVTGEEKPFQLRLLPTRKVLPATILLVDDDDDLRFVTELILSKNGYFVVSCSAAELASTAFRDSPFISLLLTDMQMPGRSGIELARELTALRPSLPVLLVSGRRPTPDAQLELRNRQWAFLSKTVDEATLLQAVGALLKRALHARSSVGQPTGRRRRLPAVS